MIILSDHEREKFATYLEQEATIYDGLVKQLSLLPGDLDTGKPLRTKAVAMAFVARELRSIETQTLGGGR